MVLKVVAENFYVKHDRIHSGMRDRIQHSVRGALPPWHVYRHTYTMITERAWVPTPEPKS